MDDDDEAAVAVPVALEPERIEARVSQPRGSVTTQVEQLSIKSHRGPLPSPTTLADYERILPGTAERLMRMIEAPIAMAQAEQHHDHQMHIAGLVCASVITLTALGGGIWLIAVGRDVGGLATILGALGAVVGAFIYGRRHPNG